MNKCPKCKRPKAEGAKFCRACYAVFGAPGGFTAISRHNRDAKIASILMQLFILFLASMAVWLIQTDFSFVKALKGSVQQTFAEAKRGVGWVADRESASSGEMAGKDDSKAAVRCDDGCPETSPSVGRRPPHLIVKIGAGAAKQQEATATLISEILACPSDSVCQGTIRFSEGMSGEYSVAGSSAHSSKLIATSPRASELLRTSSRGILEVKLNDGRVRTLRIVKRQSGKWVAAAKPGGPL